MAIEVLTELVPEGLIDEIAPPGIPPVGSLPLGVDRDMAAAGDAAHGLGLPDLMLTPGRWLRPRCAYAPEPP